MTDRGKANSIEFTPLTTFPLRLLSVVRETAFCMIPRAEERFIPHLTTRGSSYWRGRPSLIQIGREACLARYPDGHLAWWKEHFSR